MAIVDDPRTLLDLNDGEFRRVIDAFLFPAGDDAWSDLLAAPVAQRTHDTLTVMLTQVEADLTSRAAELETFRQDCWARGRAGTDDWFAARAEHEDWRRRAVRAKQAILRRKRAAKEAAYAARTEEHHAQSRYRTAVRQLAVAIAEHRRASAAGGFDPEPHDRALWQVLDQVEVPHYGRLTPVGGLLDDGVWGPTRGT
jgi:hypothetical protein